MVVVVGCFLHEVLLMHLMHLTASHAPQFSVFCGGGGGGGGVGGGGGGGRVLHHPSSLCFLNPQILNPLPSLTIPHPSVLKFFTTN